MHRRLVYIYLLNVPSFSSRYLNKIKRSSRLGRLLALSLEILSLLTYPKFCCYATGTTHIFHLGLMFNSISIGIKKFVTL